MAICRACGTPPSEGKVGGMAVAEGVGATTGGIMTGGAAAGGATGGTVTGAGAPIVTGEEEADVDEKGEIGSTSNVIDVLECGRGGGSAGDGATETGFKRGGARLRRGDGAERAAVEFV